MPTFCLPRLLVALSMAGVWAVASAQTEVEVTLQGTFSNRAVISVNGDAPRTLAVGSTVQGVKLLSVNSESAVIEVQGARRTIGFGRNTLAFPASGGSAAGASDDEGSPRAASAGRASLQADGRGHFTAQGQINGVSTSMMVDTGATLVVIPSAYARQLGIDYERASRIGAAATANGVVRVWYVTLSSVRVQGVVAYNVDAAVQEAPLGTILLGNSFLSRVQMQREGDRMALVQRY